MSSRDYYTGYEGEPELIFTRSDGADFHLWEGFFAFIMEAVDPTPSGWDGLAKPFHLDVWDDAAVEIENLPEAIAQLRAVPAGRLDEGQRETLVAVARDLSAFLDEAAASGATVRVSRQ